MRGSVEAARSITTTRPPGRHTRTISASAGRGSVRWCRANRAKTRVNAASVNGRFATAPRTNCRLVSRSSMACRRPASIIAGVVSTTTTRATRLASARLTMPVPPATSSTMSSTRGAIWSSSHGTLEVKATLSLRVLERRGLRGERGSDPFLVGVRHHASNHQPLSRSNATSETRRMCAAMARAASTGSCRRTASAIRR